MWSGLCGAQTASASPIRPTDGSGPTTVGWSGERRSQWRCMDRLGCYNVPAVSKSFLFFYGFDFSLVKTKHSVNCQPLRSFSPSSRLETDCFTGKFTRRSSVRALFRIRSETMRLLSLQGVIPRRYALQFFLPSTVQIKARSIPPHGLERSAQLSSLC